jgi:hypothetical protein
MNHIRVLEGLRASIAFLLPCLMMMSLCLVKTHHSAGADVLAAAGDAEKYFVMGTIGMSPTPTHLPLLLFCLRSVAAVVTRLPLARLVARAGESSR